MPSRIEAGRVPMVPLITMVLSAGTVAAAVFGGIAAYLYLPIDQGGVAREATIMSTGRWWGAATGLMAGIIWCVVMSAVIKRRGASGLKRIGAYLGLAVGSFSTFLLHAGLARVSGEGGVGAVGVGLIFGVPVGLLVGAVCGGVYQTVIGRSLGADPDAAEKDAVVEFSEAE